MALTTTARKGFSARRASARRRPQGTAAPDQPQARQARPRPRRTSDPTRLQIGARVKHARLLAGIRMRELAQKVGCTESMVSKIEAGRVVPSLQMLQRLVAALERDMASFFGTNLNSPGLILRAGERPLVTIDPLRKGPGVAYERLVPFAAGNLLECNIHVVQPPATSTT
jgi:transcriptional regulator with XRE-family HTH domain